MEVCGQLNSPAALPQGKEPLEPIGSEVGWDHRCPRRELKPGRSARSRVSILTELPHLPDTIHGQINPATLNTELRSALILTSHLYVC